MAQVPQATVTSVASSTSNVTLFAENVQDHGRIIFNDSTAVLYIKFGANCSASDYTVQIAAGASFVFPLGSNGIYTGQWDGIYSGQVDGLWASANGNARLTSW